MTISNLLIHPLCVGLFGGPADIDPPPAPGSPPSTYRSAMFMFLVTGGDAPVLIDTGPLDSTAARVRQNRILEQPPELRPDAVLGAHGIDPRDITTVINTHLHWDHCAYNDLFPNAKIYVQRSEVAYAVDPLEQHRVFYDKIPGVTPPWLRSWSQIETVDGDTRLTDDISLLWLPGHSPGSQGVLVHTAGGDYLVAGDTVNSAADWVGDESHRHFAPSLTTSLLDWNSSMERIEQLGCAVIPSHDLALLDQPSFGRP